MGLCHMTWSTNRFLAEKWRLLQSAASCQTNSAGHLELKESYSNVTWPKVMKKFNISTILIYFVQTKADFKAIHKESFELFTEGHVKTGVTVHISPLISVIKKMVFVEKTHISAKETAKLCHIHNPCILCFKRNYQISLNFLL